MIIVRSPLRITLGGGGTDLPSYYEEYGGFCISAAIDKYVYCSVLRPFTEGIYLKYSEIEKVKTVDEVKHPIIREALRELHLKTPQIEITTLADIPSGTGLGSSSSFTTALLKALYAHRRESLDARRLAQKACDLEINRLGSPIGVQDQYISAFGGINTIQIGMLGNVEINKLQVTMDTIHDLEDNLLLFFTGYSRSANDILKIQNDKTSSHDWKMLSNLHRIKALARDTATSLLGGDTHAFGLQMSEHWNIKKQRNEGMSNLQVDEWYNIALKNGAIGGKLVGAGGGGFLMFYASEPMKLRATMKKLGLEEVRFNFDFDGTKVLL